MSRDLTNAELTEEERRHDEAVRLGLAPGDRQVFFRRGSAIVPEAVQFLWDQWVHLGALTIFTGEPGLAKTTMALHALARLTRGTLPGEFFGKPSKVAFWTGEDSVANTLVPRMAAAKADLELVQFVEVFEDGLEDGLCLPSDVELLTKTIDDDVVAFVVDPLMAAVSGGVDAHRDHSMRRALAPLHRLADATGIAVIAISHLNKATGGGFIQRVGGSVGLTGAIRSGVLFARDPERPDDENARVMVHGKSNLSAPAPTQRFAVAVATIETDPPISTVTIAWGDEAPHLTAEDVLRGPATERPTPKLDAAAEMLNEMLKDRARLRTDIEQEADDRGVSWRTVMTAKAELEIADEQIPIEGKRGPGPSWWYFPNNPSRDGNGVQPPPRLEIADHSASPQSTNGAGSRPPNTNGVQGLQSPRETIADLSAMPEPVTDENGREYYSAASLRAAKQTKARAERKRLDRR